MTMQITRVHKEGDRLIDNDNLRVGGSPVDAVDLSLMK